MKGIITQVSNIIRDRLHIGFVTDRRMGIRLAVGRFGGIASPFSVNIVELFGLGVVRLEVGVFERPFRGNSAFVSDFVKVPFPQSNQGGAVEFGIAADPVAGLGFKGFALLVVPVFIGVVAMVLIDIEGVPVGLFSR